MNTQPTFSDAALEAMLARRARRADPGDLRDVVLAELEETRPRRFGWSFGPVRVWSPGSLRLAWMVAAAALLLALVGGLLMAGAWWQQHRPLTRLLPPGPPMATVRLAVSADEAWVEDGGGGLWQFAHGAWGPQTLFPLGVRPEVAPDLVRSLARGPDGSIWAATGTAVWRLRGGEWTKAWDGDASVIATGPDGTAWVGGQRESLTALTPVGDGLRVTTVGCPTQSILLAVTDAGSVYLGSFMYTGANGLARYDGHTCERLDPLGNGRDPDVVGLAADPRGGLVANLLDRRRDRGDWDSYFARLDAGRWTILDGPVEVNGATASVVDAAGNVWRIDGSRQGIERLEGGRWTRVVTEAEVLSLAVSPDGVLWYATPAGIERVRIDDLAP